MAVKLSSSDDELDENHEINVTPFIDVMLVLLIIFMVAAPLSTVDVNVDLPASTAQPVPRPDKPLFLTVKPDLTLMVGEEQVSRPGLGAALDLATSGDKEQRVFVRGDKAVPYGDVMEVMNLLRAAGYLKIGLVGLEAGAAGGDVPHDDHPAAAKDAVPQPGPASEAGPPPEVKP
jgi:biopolymer transport protein ExbD